VRPGGRLSGCGGGAETGQAGHQPGLHCERAGKECAHCAQQVCNLRVIQTCMQTYRGRSTFWQ
jgi:hypothetical protein